MRRCRCRFVGLLGGCDFIVSDSILARNPGRSSGYHLWRAGSCGLRVVQNPQPSPISVFRAVSIQGQFHLLPLVLVVFHGYASIGLLPDQLQASIPSAGLALTRGDFHPLNSHPFQAAIGHYGGQSVVVIRLWYSQIFKGGVN